MSKPLFACTICGEDFTRMTSADRHRKNVHNGHNPIVRYIEYIVGRASRLYPPPITPRRLLRKNMLMKFHNNNNNQWHGNDINQDTSFNDHEKSDPIDQVVDTLHKAVEIKNLTDSGNQSVPDLNPFANDSHYRGYYPNNQVSHRKKEDEIRNRDTVDETLEWWLHKLRQRNELKNLLARLRPIPQQSIIGNIAFNNSIVQPMQSTNFTNVIQHNGLQNNNNNINNKNPSNDNSLTFTSNNKNGTSRPLLGFRIHICDRCLDASLIAVFYPVSKEVTTDQIPLHTCKTGDLARSGNLPCKNNHRDIKNKMLLKSLQNKLNTSSLKHFKYLVAVPLGVNSLPEGIEGIILKMPNLENPKIPIAFSYCDETHIELDIGKDFHPGIDRALSNGYTELTNDEILEFLEMVGTATFAFIKVKRKGFVRQYFMMLSNTTVGHMQSRYLTFQH